MAEDGLILVHKNATKSTVQVTPASFTGKTSDTIDYDGLALPNFLPTILDSDGLNEVIKAIDDELGVLAGNITAGDGSQVSNTLFDANTILKADVDDTPLALTVPVDTLIGRKSGGDIDALIPADVLTVLGITATIAELNFVDGVTSAIQTQIDGNDTDITNLQAKFPVVTADIQNVAVTNAKLANNAVSNAKLDSSLQTDITQITTNKDDITTLTNLTTIAEQTIFGRRTGDGTAIGLTATQTLTLLGITVSATDINRLVGITDDVQVQIDNISGTFGNIDVFDEVTISGMTAPTSVDLTHIIASGIAFINNKRVATSDTSKTYTASKDTYVDVDDAGTFTFVEVANGADTPALTADSIRIMKVVTDVDNITGVTDLRPLDLRIDKLLGRKMDTPSGVTATLQAGGSLADGTELFYVVTATDGTGETIQSIEVSETPTGANLTIKIDWTAVTKAKFYRVYRRESGIYKLYKEVTAPTITLTDDGSAIFVTSGEPPLFTNAYRAKLEDIGDVTLEIGSTDITSGTVGRILFEGTGNFLQESANLVWDTVNDRVGFAKAVPAARVHIVGEGTTGATFSFRAENSDNSKSLELNDAGALLGTNLGVSFVNTGLMTLVLDAGSNGGGVSLRLGGDTKASIQGLTTGMRIVAKGGELVEFEDANSAIKVNFNLNDGSEAIEIIPVNADAGNTLRDTTLLLQGKFFDGSSMVTNATIIHDVTATTPTSSLKFTVGAAVDILRLESVGIATIGNDFGIVIGHTTQIDFGEITAEAQILGTSVADSTLALGLWSATDTLSPIVKFMKSGSAAIAVGNFVTVADDEELGKIQAYGADGTDLDTLVAEIQFNVDDSSVAAGQIGGEILLRTATSAGVMTEAIRIDASQNIGMGVTPVTNLHILEDNADTVPAVEIEQLGIGDAALQFSISGDAYAVGIDNATTKFTISYAATAGTAVLGTNNRLVIDSNGNIGIGIDAGIPSAAQLHIDQSSTTAADPVLLLDQADISEEFIDFVAVEAVGNPVEDVGAKSLTTTKFVRVSVNGVKLFLQVGTIA